MSAALYRKIYAEDLRIGTGSASIPLQGSVVGTGTFINGLGLPIADTTASSLTLPSGTSIDECLLSLSQSINAINTAPLERISDLQVFASSSTLTYFGISGEGTNTTQSYISKFLFNKIENVATNLSGLVAIDGSDSPGYLAGKLVEGNGTSIVQSTGSNKTMTVNVNLQDGNVSGESLLENGYTIKGVVNGTGIIITSTEGEITVSMDSAYFENVTYGIKYAWDSEAEMLLETGMSDGDLGVRRDLDQVWKYDGASWSYFFDLGTAQVYNHDSLTNLDAAATLYHHLTTTQYNLLTGGSETSIHTHDYNNLTNKPTAGAFIDIDDNNVISVTGISDIVDVSYASSHKFSSYGIPSATTSLHTTSLKPITLYGQYDSRSTEIILNPDYSHIVWDTDTNVMRNDGISDITVTVALSLSALIHKQNDGFSGLSMTEVGIMSYYNDVETLIANAEDQSVLYGPTEGNSITANFGMVIEYVLRPTEELKIVGRTRSVSSEYGSTILNLRTYSFSVVESKAIIYPIYVSDTVSISEGDTPGYIADKLANTDGVTFSISGDSNKILNIGVSLAEGTVSEGISLLKDGHTVKKLLDNEEIVAECTDDYVTLSVGAVSSTKISTTAEENLNGISGTGYTSLTGLVSAVNALNGIIGDLASATGQFRGAGNGLGSVAVPATPTKATFTVLEASSDANIFEFDDDNDWISFNIDGSYNWLTELTMTNANQSFARYLNFILRDKDTLEVVYSRFIAVPAGASNYPISSPYQFGLVAPKNCEILIAGYSDSGGATGSTQLTINNWVTRLYTQNISLDLSPYQLLSEKGVANGYASLNSSGLVPSTQLPSYVDDVIEVSNYASLPTTGESGKIYVTTDDNKTYRWSGSAYAVISETLALGETSSTAYRGDRGAISYSHSQDTYGNNPHGTIFATINNKPTTLSGYGITDAYTQTYLNTRIGNIETLLASDDTTLDEIQEIVDYIKQNRSDLENLSASNIAGLDTWGDGRYILSSGEIRPIITTSYGLFGSATLSTWVNGGGYSRFGHADYNLPVHYGFIQGSNGSVFISGSSNTVAGDLSVEGYITATGTATAAPATADTHLATLGQAKALTTEVLFSKLSGTIDSSQFSPDYHYTTGDITVNTTSIYEAIIGTAGNYVIEIDVMCSNIYTPEIEYSDNNWSTKTIVGTTAVSISTTQYKGVHRATLTCPSGRRFRLRWGGNITTLTHMDFRLKRIS